MATDSNKGSAPRGLLLRAWERLWQLQCGITGHDRTWSFQGAKTTLKCTNCGHETSGWTAQNSTKPRFSGDPERHKLR